MKYGIWKQQKGTGARLDHNMFGCRSASIFFSNLVCRLLLEKKKHLPCLGAGERGYPADGTGRLLDELLKALPHLAGGKLERDAVVAGHARSFPEITRGI